MKNWIYLLYLLIILTIFNCADIEDLTENLDGNLNLELIYTDSTTIKLTWDNTESSTTTLNLQSFVFDPSEHDSSMTSASENATIQLESFTNENTTNVTVTASYYYVFMLSNMNNEFYDCAESSNSSIMQSFELCQTYLYLWGIFN